MSATKIVVPDIGDVETVDVIEVLVSPGSEVTKEQGLIVIESDKASMEVPSPAAGTIREVSVKVGDKVSKGTLIALLESGEGASTEPTTQDEPAPDKQDEKPAAPEKKPAAEKKAAAPEKKPAPEPKVEAKGPEAVTKIVVPDIGDVETVDVIEVLVSPGSEVTKEQGLIVIESDKASMEVPSPAAGTIREVSVKVGDKVSKGALIALLASAGGGDEAQEEPKPTPAKKLDAKAPEPKAAAKEVRESGLPTEAEAEKQRDEFDPQSMTRTVPPPPPPPRESLSAPIDKKPHASPSLRKLARELGVDLRQVPGTGPHKRITRQDVQSYVKHAMSHAGTATGTGFAFPELPEIDFSQFGETKVEPLTKIQKLTGRNTHRSWMTIPHVTQHDEADITELEAFRQKMRRDNPDVKLTLTAFFVKALGVMLKHMPRFNSSLDKSGENLILKSYFNIGVAVDTPNGLVVPVIREVDQKGLSELALELAQVSERARNRKLMPQDMQGASMTVSSLGGIGGTFFTPIINPPEVAVLGVSRASLRPVYVDGKLEPRLIVGLSLSYDHRVIDGADGVRFTSRLRDVLSDIREMLL
jgi:pyruvate dehydrogenase E2 component (dihydrolipoamide acetyltransferase)